MSSRPASAPPGTAAKPHRLADVLSAGLAAMNLKTEDTEVKRGRDGLTREQAQHVTVVNMGLDLSPLNTAGVTAFDEQRSRSERSSAAVFT